MNEVTQTLVQVIVTLTTIVFLSCIITLILTEILVVLKYFIQRRPDGKDYRNRKDAR
jgi:cytochrome bd-type quinol oxidase subunit 1